MIDFVIIAVVALILGLAGLYIRKEKKAGKTCVGCPYSGNCSGGCSGCSGSCGCGPEAGCGCGGAEGGCSCGC